MAKFALVETESGRDVMINLDLICLFMTKVSDNEEELKLNAAIQGSIETFYSKNPETIEKIKKYIKENML